MGARAEAFADEFERRSQEFGAEIERYTPEQMQAQCGGEQCTVAALASHVAEGQTVIVDWVAKAAAGKPLPEITMDDINAMNAEQFSRDANRPKEEILAALRENTPQTVNILRNIDDDDLDRSQHFTLVNQDVTADWLTRNILINEFMSHPSSIRAACEQPASA